MCRPFIKNPLGPIVDIAVTRLSASDVTSFGDRFCFSRKGGTGQGGWVHPKGANSIVVSGLGYRNDLGGTGRAISELFGINGVRNQQSHVVGPPFPAFKASFSAIAVWHFSRDLT